MKKFFAIATAAAMVLGATGCNEKASAGKGGSALADSVSMTFGDLYGNGMGGQLKQDSTLDMKAVLRGMEMVLRADTSHNNSVLTGMQIGMNIKQMYEGIKQQYGVEINQKVFLDHFKKALLADSTMTQDQLMELQSTIEPLLKRASAEAKANDPVAKQNKADGEAFLKKKAAEPGYTTTPGGVVYKVITEGTGNNFTEEDVVMVNYRGTHIDGKEFDKSQEPVPFRMRGVVQGFAEMLKLMKPGMKVECIIPAELAYGEDGNQVIGPNETLVFEMETVGVQPQDDAAPAPKPAK